MKKIRLGDYINLITDYHSGGSYETMKKMTKILHEPSYAVMIRTINFENNNFNGDFVYCDKDSYDFLEYSHVNENDILMNKIANPGSVYIMPKVNYKVTCGLNLFLIRLKELNQRYMYYMMKYRESYIKSMAHGTTTKTITKDEVRDLIFWIHESSEEQYRIEKLLSNIEYKIALNNRINSKLEQMAKRLYDYWFVQFDFPGADGKPYKTNGGKMIWNEELKREIPKEWEVKKVKDVIDPIERGLSYTSDDILNCNGIPMINLACFDKAGNYRTGELKYYSGDYLDNDLLNPMDIVIACTDLTQKADIIGTPIFVSTEYANFVFSTDLAKLTPRDKLNKFYIYYYLKNDTFHRYIKPYASGTTVKHLNLNGVLEYPYIQPNEDLLNSFNKLIEPIRKEIVNLQTDNVKLTALRDKLLPMLMNGQVSVI